MGVPIMSKISVVMAASLKVSQNAVISFGCSVAISFWLFSDSGVMRKKRHIRSF